MTKRADKLASIEPRRQGWPSLLVKMAATARTDGGRGLCQLLDQEGFSSKPMMTVLVKRARPPASDPVIDDVLDALSALCA